ncbi:MAG: hypothetical protein R3B57_12485 [Phycisphaerales bacterium]
MDLIYCGIDEAGYGPMFGPLCVGMAAFRVRGWEPDGHAPDLWKLLSKGVCRSGGDKRGRVAIADSKKLKLANSLKTKHPLTHLERGVLSMLAAAEEKSVEDDTALFERLGVELEPHGWYGGAALGLPLSSTQDQIGIAANIVARAMAQGGVELVALRCVTVCEGAFNERVRECGSKAAVSGGVVAALMGEASRQWGTDSTLRLVCDRQSGRTDYEDFVRPALGEDFETLEQSARASRYAARDGRDVGALFIPECEDHHLPVALASMTAKLVRELAMTRFNRYWSGRSPDLKPTAGYTTDARRWLRDAEGVVGGRERAEMVRIA